MEKFRTILILTLLMISTIYFMNDVRAQPTWNFKAYFLPSDFYMGEWGTLQANITNYDCTQRRDWKEHFDKILREDLEAIEQRAEDMKNMNLIGGYSIDIKRSWGYGGVIYHEADVHLYGVCSGRSIKILWVRFWFDWSRYGGREAAGFEAQVNRVLKAYDPIQYVLNGASPESSVIVSTRIFIPEWIEPDERLKRPYLDIRVDYPGWIEYTLEKFPVGGPFEIQPYRSFNLTITDFDGVHKLSGAKVVIRQLVHYYRVREYMTPENGTIRIWRLLEGRYDVRIYWNSSYRQEHDYIYVGQPTAYDLASSGTVKTNLFNIRINPLDMRGRALKGAKVIFDGFEEPAENGTAIYELVPEGNHTVQIYWKGVKVLDEWLWVGYQPTIQPVVTSQAEIYNLKLPVDDLIIQATDTGGGSVGANYTVMGPSPELNFKDVYSRNGTLIIRQLPIARYHVKAVNCSNLFKRCVEAEGDYEPGRKSRLILPIHSIKLRILSNSSKPLKNAYIKLGPASLMAGEDGFAWFKGVPEGKYRIEVEWRNLTVYEGWIDVAGSMEENIRTRVYDINLKFLTNSGKSYLCLLNFTAPAGINIAMDNPVKSFSVEYVPEGSCDLAISTIDGVRLRELKMNCSEMAELEEVTLPVSDMRLRVAWSDGSPIERCRIEVYDLVHGRKFNGLTDENGAITFKDMIFSNYTIKISYPYTPILMKTFNETFKGDEIVVKVEEAWLRVKVVDLLGNPLSGAEVTVFYGLVPIQKSVTGADGTAYFKRLLKLPTYTIHVRYGSNEKRVYARPDESLEARMNVIGFGDMGTILKYVVVVAVVAAVLIISIKLILYVKSALR
ncbi:MAG: carboxypeptidase regulatory-like domain-containing protein [Thaumarchaeota archaeon]|nr:carboxypeptidase regulatory-like domain-containing protein [Nitrososphaerota archaeon]